MRKALIPALAILLILGVALSIGRFMAAPKGQTEQEELRIQVEEAYEVEARLTAKIEISCGRCHGFPQPDVLPRSAWRENIIKMYAFIGLHEKPLDGLDAGEVIAWYERRAPQEIPLRAQELSEDESPVKFHRRGISPPQAPADPAVSNVNVVNWTPGRPSVLLTDIRHHAIVLADFPTEELTGVRFSTVGHSPHPCRTDFADIDRDGLEDVIIADLGSFQPRDHHVCGSRIKPRGR